MRHPPGIKHGRYEEAMELHFGDVRSCYCRKCDRTFKTTSQLYVHYQTESHKKRAQKLRAKQEGESE